MNFISSFYFVIKVAAKNGRKKLFCSGIFFPTDVIVIGSHGRFYFPGGSLSG